MKQPRILTLNAPVKSPNKSVQNARLLSQILALQMSFLFYASNRAQLSFECCAWPLGQRSPSWLAHGREEVRREEESCVQWGNFDWQTCTLCLGRPLERFLVLASGRVCGRARGKRSFSKRLLRHKVCLLSNSTVAALLITGDIFLCAESVVLPTLQGDPSSW